MMISVVFMMAVDGNSCHDLLRDIFLLSAGPL
jgi:hypothetical protein